MHLAGQVMRVSQGLFNAIRSRDAGSAADGDASGTLDGFRGRKYCLVVTYRRSGEPMPTPVWFGLGRSELYFRSLPHNGKTKRIRNDGRVRIAPCDARGRPIGPPVDARARILAPDQEPIAEAAIRANYGLGRRIYNWAAASRVAGVYVEVTPAASDHVAADIASRRQRVPPPGPGRRRDC